MKIVAHEESTAIQEIAHLYDLSVGKLPVPDLDRVQPRIVEYIIAIVEIYRLLDRAHVYARQTPECSRDMPIGGGIVSCPTRAALLPVSKSPKATVSTLIGRIH